MVADRAEDAAPGSLQGRGARRLRLDGCKRMRLLHAPAQTPLLTPASPMISRDSTRLRPPAADRPRRSTRRASSSRRAAAAELDYANGFRSELAAFLVDEGGRTPRAPEGRRPHWRKLASGIGSPAASSSTTRLLRGSARAARPLRLPPRARAGDGRVQGARGCRDRGSWRGGAQRTPHCLVDATAGGPLDRFA
eukprot:1386822-Prymnesium_polylepis.1